MADFDNLFDAAIARADETIRGYMGTSATMTSGEQSGAVIRGVFDDPENISYAGQGVRVEGSSPSLFVRTDESYSRRVYSATEKWPVACHAACGREKPLPH
ncbi:Phage capsid and scaffold [Escherichia coli]|nr:Phage capsid and scaffold [Escherichia coli]